MLEIGLAGRWICHIFRASIQRMYRLIQGWFWAVLLEWTGIALLGEDFLFGIHWQLLLYNGIRKEVKEVLITPPGMELIDSFHVQSVRCVMSGH
jgi:hypothetical protein